MNDKDKAEEVYKACPYYCAALDFSKHAESLRCDIAAAKEPYTNKATAIYTAAKEAFEKAIATGQAAAKAGAAIKDATAKDYTKDDNNYKAAVKDIDDSGFAAAAKLYEDAKKVDDDSGFAAAAKLYEDAKKVDDDDSGFAAAVVKAIAVAKLARYYTAAVAKLAEKDYKADDDKAAKALTAAKDAKDKAYTTAEYAATAAATAYNKKKETREAYTDLAASLKKSNLALK